MVPGENVDHCTAIGNHIALEAPFAAQLILQQKLVRAARLAVDRVVRAHHRSCVAFRYSSAKRRQISIDLIVLAHIHIGHVPRRLRPAMHCEMLRSRNHPVVFRIVALHPRHKRHRHPPRQKWILAIRLLPASPARIAKDVHVGSPEIKAFEDVAVPRALGLHVLDAPLDADRRRHLMNARCIERRRQTDRLRELRRPVHRDPMQRLAPPVVGRYVQTRNGARLIHQLRSLLLQRHPLHQVRSPLLRRQTRVHVRQRRRLLRSCGNCDRADANQGRSPCAHRGICHMLPP